MAAYYNEIEPYAAQWLRNLIKAGHIADGEVDERSIINVRPTDLAGFTQCHFFAGIGGWSHALRLAGWPDDRPIWTGSCPCQPFSVAGKGAGIDDPRHLWPHFFCLIGAVRPPVVMGEQVAGAAGYGWLDGVRADLEAEKYACRGVDIPACAVDAPHIRSRLYWVASDLGDANHARLEGQLRHGDGGSRWEGEARPVATSGRSHMADADHERRDGIDALLRQDEAGRNSGDIHEAAGRRPANSFWSDAIWLTGADGKSRRAQPGIPLLAHGVSDCLANVLSICKVASKRIDDHAERSQADPSEILRMVREHLYKEASGEGQSTGVCGKLYAPQVLFDFMLSQATTCNRGADSSSVKKAGKDTVAGAMHIMRMDGGFVCPPSQWQSDGQQRVQSANPLHELSLLLACDAQAFGKAVLDAHAAINRVGMLRAYGNAIVPPLAAEVIGAYLDAEKPCGGCAEVAEVDA